MCVCLWMVAGGCGRRKRGNLREGRRKERRKCEWRESEAAGTKIWRRPKEQGEPQQDSCAHLCIFPHPASANHRVLLPLTSDLKVLAFLRQSVWNQIALIYHFVSVSVSLFLFCSHFEATAVAPLMLLCEFVVPVKINTNKITFHEIFGVGWFSEPNVSIAIVRLCGLCLTSHAHGPNEATRFTCLRYN